MSKRFGTPSSTDQNNRQKRLATDRSDPLASNAFQKPPPIDPHLLVEEVPSSLKKSICDALTAEEWHGRVRHLVSYLFYRFRYFDTATIGHLLNGLEPMSQVVTIQHEVSTVKAMINEIQTDICKSHKGMARLWLASVRGLQWIDGLEEQRHRGRKLQWVTADFVLHNFFCDLTPSELAALWCPIVDAVDQSHWNRSDDDIYLNLRQDSFDLISKMINGLHVGVAAHRATNTQARFRMLQAITKTDNHIPWPLLPKDDSLYPTTVDGWKAYKQHYNVCQDDIGFARIFQCFGQEGAALFTSITGNKVGEVLATIDKEHRDFHAEPTTPGNSTVESTFNSPNHTALVVSASQQSAASESTHTRPRLSVSITDAELSIHQTASTSTDHIPFEDSPTTHDVFLTETGHMVSCGTYDDEDEPGFSPGMYLGPEAERVDSNRISLISRFLDVDRASDMAAIARFVERVNPPIEFLCQRAFDLARLGGDGLTRYCMDIMHADALIYEELTQYFANRQAHCLRQTRTLMDEMTTVNGKLAAFERQTANFRLDSSQCTTNQSQLNASRRHLQRLQAQANAFLRFNLLNPATLQLPQD
ncbi:hypothetical protein FN846DRAFT_889222 [Sphaerosporella brunnea]|uniref:Uncharacterized protein n=1 Tax=Sphaerosporella brunnea TaxID=1250544 RepID=A0A5J5F001_9PEZI|nr:hypothetical protein FN846DRAFT_889222 [Sphaerosporella brunnea]